MNTRAIAALLAICLTVSLVAAGGTAAQSDPAVGFGDAAVVGTQGDVVTVEVQLQNTETGQLRIRAADRSYRGNVDVRDGDDDGTVRIQINTFRGVDTDDETDVEAAADADAATLVSESTTQEGATFDAGRYNLIAATEGTSATRVSPWSVSAGTPTITVDNPPHRAAADRSRDLTALACSMIALNVHNCF